MQVYAEKVYLFPYQVSYYSASHRVETSVTCTQTSVYLECIGPGAKEAKLFERIVCWRHYMTTPEVPLLFYQPKIENIETSLLSGDKLSRTLTPDPGVLSV